MDRIGLVDVDGGKFPNYALMKIARYYKQQGIEVEWADPMFGNYDKAYISKMWRRATSTSSQAVRSEA